MARGVKIDSMRGALPFILVGLAIFTAACIAYIAWELSSEKRDEKAPRSHRDD
jgi:hypothetical protein